MLGLRFCARAFSSCGKRGPLFIAVRGPLTTMASLVAEHSLQTRRLSSCGSRAYLLRGMWDLPRPGLEPVSPALAGRFSTTAPPGKPCMYFIGSNGKGFIVHLSAPKKGDPCCAHPTTVSHDSSKDFKVHFYAVSLSPSATTVGYLAQYPSSISALILFRATSGVEVKVCNY